MFVLCAFPVLDYALQSTAFDAWTQVARRRLQLLASVERLRAITLAMLRRSFRAWIETTSPTMHHETPVVDHSLDGAPAGSAMSAQIHTSAAKLAGL